MNASANSSPVTLHDVAREAGVSLATASRAINGSERNVAESYRKRVLEAAARLNYSPNLSAQAVARGSSQTVALLVSDIADPYFSSIAAGVIRGAEQHGLIVSMSVTDRRADRELELVRALRGQRPRVIILTGSRFAASAGQDALVAELEAYQATGGRVVLISQRELPFSTVQLDNYTGARRLAGALVDLGYRSFAAVTGERTLLTSRDRLAGFMDGLAEHGIAIHPENIDTTDFTRDGGFAATERLLQKPTFAPVELVFAVNDVMAVGVMSALRSAGHEPGTGIAVAGFDDIPTAADITPALTTVRVPLEDIGARAIALALADGDVGAVVSIDTDIVVRESTPRR